MVERPELEGLDMRQFWAGEQVIFKVLLSLYVRPLWEFCGSINDQLSKDNIVAEAFYRLYHYRLACDKADKIPLFLFGIVAELRKQAFQGKVNSTQSPKVQGIAMGPNDFPFSAEDLEMIKVEMARAIEKYIMPNHEKSAV